MSNRPKKTLVGAKQHWKNSKDDEDKKKTFGKCWVMLGKWWRMSSNAKKTIK